MNTTAKTLVTAILLLQSFLSFGQSPGDSLFDNSYVHTIHIDFYEPNFWDTLTAYYDLIYDFNGLPTGEKKYLPAQITIDGNVLDTVGIRQKGFLSNWGVFSGNKKPLKVDINEFVSGQKYDGLKKFNLNNGFDDPSMMRELVALDLMRNAGIVAPRVAYANVYLNGTHWGLYILMEQVDKTFLKENFSNGNGNLYKSIAATSLSWQGNSHTSYEDEVELKTNEDINDWSDFIRFMKVINQVGYAAVDYEDSLNTVFNVDDYFKILSIDVLINNWDSYYDHGRNFYIYHNPDDDKFHWIPWDYNLSFADFSTDILFQNIPPPMNGNSRPLIDNTLAVNNLKNQYFDAYCNQFAYNFTLNRIEPIIDSTRVLIESHHAASTSEFFTTAEMVQNLSSSISGQFGFSFPGLKPMITNRTTAIQNELNQQGHSCNTSYAMVGDIVINEFMAANDSTTNIADQDGEFDDWIELYNNTNAPIDLNGYYLSDDFDNPTKWSIPDVTLDADDYLIIWADDDVQQSGLHANFKLSKGGEELILSAPDNSVLDSIAFGAQQLSYSFARLPNGTGSFSVAVPTFDGSNIAVSTNHILMLEGKVKVYPNPAVNNVTIEFAEWNDIQSVSLVNSIGQTVLEQTVEPSSDRLYLDTLIYPEGMYFIVIRNNEQKTFSQKLMIMR